MSKLTKEDLLNEFERLNESYEENSDDLLGFLLGKIKKRDFSELAQSKQITKNSNKGRLIIAIELIIELFESNKYYIARSGYSICIYNGKYWKKHEDDRVKTFLTRASQKFGLAYELANYYRHQEDLFKQLLSVIKELKSLSVAGKECRINLLNGTLLVSSDGIELQDHDHKFGITYILPFDYNPECEAIKFRKFLNEVLPDLNDQKVLAEYIGYTFINGLKLEKVLLLFGTGSNGKSVIFDIISALLGKVNISNHCLGSLTRKEGYYRCMIEHKLLNYSSEIGKYFNTTIFKQLASGEPIIGRLPHKEPVTIYQYPKLMFNCNQLPLSSEVNHAFFRRLMILHFKKEISKENQDKDLAKKIIKTELSGILNWVLEGTRRILKNKEFTSSETSKNIILKLKEESDLIKEFLDSNGFVKSESQYIKHKDLYKDYRNYSLENGAKYKSRKEFRNHLEYALMIKSTRRSEGNVFFIVKSI